MSYDNDGISKLQSKTLLDMIIIIIIFFVFYAKLGNMLIILFIRREKSLTIKL